MYLRADPRADDYRAVATAVVIADAHQLTRAAETYTADITRHRPGGTTTAAPANRRAPAGSHA